MDGVNFIPTDKDCPMNLIYDTQPGAAKGTSGPLESPVTDFDGRAMSSGALGTPDNAAGMPPTGKVLKSSVDY